MIAVVQRVKEASVSVEGEVKGEIGEGLLILLGVAKGDGSGDAAGLAKKTALMRIFRDEAGKMNRSVMEVGGSVLVVSQFTLCADTTRGRRPGFERAAAPEDAERLYLEFVEVLRAMGVRTETGVFRADMAVTLTNDGPVTMIVDTLQSTLRATQRGADVDW